jgi:hypothetical protein
VIHSYKSGWKGESIIPDPPVPGALAFMKDALPHFRVVIFSSRSSSPGGILAMKQYIERYCRESWHVPWWLGIEFPTNKPSAFVTIDDRAITFNGIFPAVHELVNFKTWIEKQHERDGTA